jgi:hypothetical protein
MPNFLKFVGPPMMSDGHESVAHFEHAAELRGWPAGTPAGRAFVQMMEGFSAWLEALEIESGDPRDDHYMAPEFREMARAIIRLLSGEHGGVDAHSVDSNLRDYFGENFTEED